jgi:hypothetical protein
MAIFNSYVKLPEGITFPGNKHLPPCQLFFESKVPRFHLKSRRTPRPALDPHLTVSSAA